MMSNRPLYLMIALSCLALLAGCSGPLLGQSTPMANSEAALRNPPVDMYPAPAARTEGSLYSDAGRVDMFSDVKAAQIGDIITINVVETSKAAKDAKTDLGRSNQVTANINALVGLENNRPLLASKLAKNWSTSTGIDADYQSKFKGSGKTTRNDSMTAQVSARVIQILPNGNLVVRGSREIKVNNEKQVMIIQGVVRREDINPDNTVLSTYLADAKIDYIGKGDIARQQRQGWISRALDVVWPF